MDQHENPETPENMYIVYTNQSDSINCLRQQRKEVTSKPAILITSIFHRKRIYQFYQSLTYIYVNAFTSHKELYI